MIDGFDPGAIVACALRPQGSWLHLASLLGFVLAAWGLAPARPDAEAADARAGSRD